MLIIDDSALVRKMLVSGLEKDKEITVVGTAADPFIARDKIVRLEPDVLLLDIEMPRMDGLTFLRKLMKHYPQKVIVVSSLAEKGSEVAFKAFEYGALEVVAKPDVSYSVDDMIEQLIHKVKAVNMSKMINMKVTKNNVIRKSNVRTKETSLIRTTNKIVAIGASTGGTEAIKNVLETLPVDCPPIVIVQHMPPMFTKKFAERLNQICKIRVKEAEHMELLAPGKALIAPGNYHMELIRSGATYHVKLNQKPRVFHQRPSVDVLFETVATFAGKNAIGVLLTGMGRDGAKGLGDMKNRGAYTIAQDEKSSVVYGMPKEAVEIGAVNKVLPLDRIGGEIVLKA